MNRLQAGIPSIDFSAGLLVCRVHMFQLSYLVTGAIHKTNIMIFHKITAARSFKKTKDQAAPKSPGHTQREPG